MARYEWTGCGWGQRIGRVVGGKLVRSEVEFHCNIEDVANKI